MSYRPILVAGASAAMTLVMSLASSPVEAAGPGYAEPRTLSTIEPYSAPERRPRLADPQPVAGRDRRAAARSVAVGDPLPPRSRARITSVTPARADADYDPIYTRPSDRRSYSRSSGYSSDYASAREGYRRDEAADGFDGRPSSPNALPPAYDRRVIRDIDTRKYDRDRSRAHRYDGRDRYDGRYRDSGWDVGIGYGWHGGRYGYRQGFHPYVGYGSRYGYSYGRPGHYGYRSSYPRYYRARPGVPNHYYGPSRDRYSRQDSGLDCYYNDYGSRGHSKGCVADMGLLFRLFD